LYISFYIKMLHKKKSNPLWIKWRIRLLY